jgi:DNA-binding transcriptional LysR family regulator
MLHIPFMQDVHIGSLDLNLVRVLDALLEHRSVTKAAKKLGLSQSATSHALARLRLLLRDPLFVRDRQAFEPTTRAAALAQPLRQALIDLERALSPAPVFEPRTTRRRFTIATADYAQFVLLPELVKRLTREAPGVDLWLRIFTEPNPERAASEEADVVIGPRLDVSMGGAIVERSLFDERFVCILRSGHPALNKRWTPERFAALQHVLIAPGGKPGGTVDEALARLKLDRRVTVGVPHFLSAPYIVATSDLVATVPERLAHLVSRSLSLEVKEPPIPVPGFAVFLYWHRRFHDDPAHVWLRSQIVAASLKQRGNRPAKPATT